MISEMQAQFDSRYKDWFPLYIYILKGLEEVRLASINDDIYKGTSHYLYDLLALKEGTALIPIYQRERKLILFLVDSHMLGTWAVAIKICKNT